MTWLSLLCPSCRPDDLNRWLDSLYDNCLDAKGIELSLTIEEPLDEYQRERWGNVVTTIVKHGQCSVNQLTEICYKQSTSPYIFLSGDDTVCHNKFWDKIFYDELMKYPDKVVLVYPNDLIFGKSLACYPVTSRLVMDSVAWPVPYQRYAIDDTIFDIVPTERRIYLEDVIMEHKHLVDHPPGHAVIRDGKVLYYPHNLEAMAADRALYEGLYGQRSEIRKKLEDIAGLKMSHRVMLCVPTAEFARRADFYDYLEVLEKPEGTMKTTAHGASPARNRNIMIKLALENNATHCLFIDDDMAFRPDMLKRLLRHDVDIVSGLYLMRNYPHLPVMFDESFADGKCKFKFLTPGTKGLVEVVNTGLGACLIKTEVFKKMPHPWITLGECEPDHWSDDIAFFNRARKYGFKIHVDLEVPCGHMMSAIIWPNRDVSGNWFTMYNTGSAEMVQMPQHIPTQEEIDKQLKESGILV